MRKFFGNMWFMLCRIKQFNRWLLGMILVEVVIALGLSFVALRLTQELINLVMRRANAQEMVVWIISLIGLYSVLQLAGKYVSYKSSFLTQMLRMTILSKIVTVLLHVDYQLLTEDSFEKSKQLALGTCSTALSMTQTFPINLKRLFEQLAKIGLFAALLSVINRRFLALIGVMLVFVIAYRFFQHGFINRTREERSRYSDQYSYINRVTSNFSLAKDIRLFRVSPWFESIFSDVLMKLRRVTFRRGRVVLAGQLISSLGILALTLYGYAVLIKQLHDQTINLGQLMFYIGAISMIAVSSTELINVIFDLIENHADITHLRAFLHYPPVFNHEAKAVLPETIESIELKDVTFSYPKSEKPVLEKLNLKIQRNEKLAIVGLNGAGKTTLVQLICNLYKPDSGQILINGIDNQQFAVNDYYELFSVVFQDHYTLPETIRDAVVQNDSFDEVKYHRVLAQSGLDQVIRGLPLGDRTELVKEVSPDAITLSGGQLQKLKLAQALYKDAPILILDEPTASLDPIAESELYLRYHTHALDKLSIFISHRLATTQFCDRIIYLEDGQILEDGSHQELLRMKGKYAEMYYKQAYYYQEGDSI